MLKLCNKDALAYPFEGSPDTVPPLFSMLDSSEPPHWSSELAREPLPPQACSLGAGLEGTKIFLQATNVKGGSGLKKLSQGAVPSASGLGDGNLGLYVSCPHMTLYFVQHQ